MMNKFWKLINWIRKFPLIIKVKKLIHNFFLIRKIEKTFKIKLNNFQKHSLLSCLEPCIIDKRYGSRQCGATTSMELESLYLSIFHNKFIVLVFHNYDNLYRVFKEMLKFSNVAKVIYSTKGKRIYFKNGGMILLTNKSNCMFDLFGLNDVFKIICDNVDFKDLDEIFYQRSKNLRLYKTFK